MTDNTIATRKKLLDILKEIKNPPVRGKYGGRGRKKPAVMPKGSGLTGGVLSGSGLTGGIHAAGLTGGKPRRKRGGMSAGMHVGGISAGANTDHLDTVVGGKHRRKRRGGATIQEALEETMKAMPRTGGANPWLAHLKKFRMAHPSMSYKECMSAAKASYK